MAISDEERALIARAVQRDREAFALLYTRYHDPVMRCISRIVDDPDEASDITSETFLRAWNAIARFEDRGASIQAWLCTIGERLAFKQVKKRRSYVELEDLYLEADADEAPERLFELQAEAADIRAALIELPEVQRQVLSQRFMEGLSYDAIGASMGKRAGTVRVIQHRALRALKVLVTKKSMSAPAGGST